VVTIGAAVLDIFMKSDKFKVVKSGDIPGGIAMCEVYGGKMEVEEVLIVSGGGGDQYGRFICQKRPENSNDC